MLEECNVYIYDLHFGDFSDVEYGAGIFNNATLEDQKVFILISDVMVWGQTPRKEKEDKPKPAGEGGEENPDGNNNNNEN